MQAVTDLEIRFREEIRIMAEGGGDMCLHMMPLFDLVLQQKPKLIVELGVRGGMSTYALDHGARIVGAKMIAVDRDDCSGVCGDAHFVRADDVEFAGQFCQYCQDRGIPPSIDILMIDTEHTYEQTKREVEAWLPYLAFECRIVFHDTNCQPFYFGVAEFLREWLEISFPEQVQFEAISKGWHVKHNPDCFGLTIIWREI